MNCRCHCFRCFGWMMTAAADDDWLGLLGSCSATVTPAGALMGLLTSVISECLLVAAAHAAAWDDWGVPTSTTGVEVVKGHGPRFGVVMGVLPVDVDVRGLGPRLVAVLWSGVPLMPTAE